MNAKRKTHSLKEDAIESLNKAFQTITSKIDNADRSFLEGVVKFNSRLSKMSINKLGSFLHAFGTTQYHNKKVNTSSSLFFRRSQKNKISVQPEAVKRRKGKSGSKRALPKGKSSNLLPVKAISTKRKHKFTTNVENNEPVAKKAGRNMMSKTKNIISIKEKEMKKTLVIKKH